ncbi:MAG: tRNA (adenosine(37)-N6)-threonylcarbamoyltransferase complex ATPase subunit type 1 TsaE [Alphaproteobacteria bacterium]|nr:tRNA (adenosine(37)-N6)-threonylcarbamoyltransferase complex ATPase subunit type 1 TsaE [Alphaproteobacteria bacterium]
MNHISHSEEETITVARAFAQNLKLGDIVLMHGDLGVGKSVFCRAIIHELCCNGNMDVPSPTFTLVQTYDFEGGEIWHFDLYRLSDPSEIYELGWEEAVSNAIVLVEWPSRLGNLKPDAYIDVTLKQTDGEENRREIEVQRHG